MNDYALILAGGGAKGAYQIGVWRAMRDLSVDKKIGAVAGTSVGALNGALFVSGEYGNSKKLWTSIEHKDILSIDKMRNLSSIIDLHVGLHFGLKYIVLKNLMKFTSGAEGFFSRSGLSEIISKNLDFEALKSSPIPLYITLHNRNAFKAEYVKVNLTDSDERIKKLLLATSAIPVVFGAEIIDGKFYYDGGLSDNCPVKPLYDIGFRKFIVVWLSDDAAPMASENSKKFPNAKFVDIIPSEEQGNFITGTLDFSSSGIAKRMDLGYNDALSVLSKAFDIKTARAKKNTKK